MTSKFSNFQAQRSQRRVDKARVSTFDSLSLAGIGVGLVYMAARQPVFFSVLGVSSLLYLTAWQMLQMTPVLERWMGRRIKIQHVVVAISTTTLLASAIQPAHALFLSGLEAFFVDLAAQAQSGGAGETLDDSVIGLVFNLIRGVFLLLVAAAALFAYNQAQQGNDWRPIVTQVGLAFAIVIAIDVVTFIFIGNAV
ncbi:hypothetical protein H6G62_19305 [Phormidium sp. FACHB-1136]|nr:hypothetical protein [Phormidium sp. FACHB-1136]